MCLGLVLMDINEEVLIFDGVLIVKLPPATHLTSSAGSILDLDFV